MNNKIDRRTKYTKKIIRESFLALLKERKIENITVVRICELADINRTTFYRYYEDQYDLLSEIENEVMQEIKNGLSLRENNLVEFLQQLLSRVYEKREIWRLLLSERADLGFRNKLYGLFDSFFFNESFSKEIRMCYRFMFSGYSGLFEYWIENGLKETPDEMIKYIIFIKENVLSSNISNKAP